jgi:hypothetical protein
LFKVDVASEICSRNGNGGGEEKLSEGCMMIVLIFLLLAALDVYMCIVFGFQLKLQAEELNVARFSLAQGEMLAVIV